MNFGEAALGCGGEVESVGGAQESRGGCAGEDGFHAVEDGVGEREEDDFSGLLIRY